MNNLTNSSQLYNKLAANPIDLNNNRLLTDDMSNQNSSKIINGWGGEDIWLRLRTDFTSPYS